MQSHTMPNADIYFTLEYTRCMRYYESYTEEYWRQHWPKEWESSEMKDLGWGDAG